MKMLTISELNSLNFQDFIAKTGNVVEHCPIVAGVLWKQRPFQSFEDLNDKIKEIVQSLPQPLKEGILLAVEFYFTLVIFHNTVFQAFYGVIQTWQEN